MDPDKPKRKYWRFVAGFLAMIFLAFGVVVALRVQEINKAAKEEARKQVEMAEKIVEKTNREQEVLYQKQLADTYGGKTPQETLRMYIAAVEKGDYELASKYFVVEKQEKELKILKSAPEENTEKILSLLKQSIEKQGSYSSTGNAYTIRKPILVDFVIYPSGVWKIIEI